MNPQQFDEIIRLLHAIWWSAVATQFFVLMIAFRVLFPKKP